MQKIIKIDNNKECQLWENLWSTRTIEQELEACEIEWAPKLMFLKHLDKSDKIIDAGCGFGKWVIYLYNRGYNIIGVDNNELAISELRNYNPKIEIKFGDILNLNFPDNHFDGYISMGVVEHFKGGPMEALKEAYRVLKPNGLIFLSTPTVNLIRKFIVGPMLKISYSSPQIIDLLVKFRNFFFKKRSQSRHQNEESNLNTKNINYYIHFLEYRFTISELQDYLKQSGFEIINTLPHDFPGSKNHGIGLSVDFPMFRKKNGYNFELNTIGKLISRLLNWISPWIACASVLCVARSLKTKS
ncbi:MAG: methyltransferase domain-containing protein [Candidatus Lokiarchaeota archaeon]|nr:methyltransferase domain-containing protein [Candidatus Lokiarchaeota archaeon]MBD3200820.1 methyltransferase domain-containing protein [Candidatus Lokiarchaeota archaeon]